MTFGWDSNQLGEIETFLENRFGTERNKALKLARLKTPRRTTEELEIRKIESGNEWEAVLQLQLLISGESRNPAYIEFKQRKFHSYREASEKGFGDWWGAFRGGRLVGDFGLYFNTNRSLARFQNVETHPDFRKQGICSNMLYTAIHCSLEERADTTFIICAEKENSSYRVYRSLGFEDCGSQFGVSLPCPYEKRFEQKEAPA